MKAIKGRALILTWLLLLPAGAALFAQANVDSSIGARPRSGDRVKKLHDANLARYKASPDMLVLPGLLANRKKKQIELLAESTGLAGNGTAEFLLVDQSSSHGYEALLWSLAKPSDVHAALVFIGMQPGAPFDPEQLRLWPKGERVYISVAPKDGSAGTAPLRIENLILDRKTGQPLPESGFLFTGSIKAPAPRGATGVVYTADVYDPKSVASLYNDPGTVLDVPRQANQGEVYETQIVNPEHEFAAGELLTLILEPERKDGGRRVQNLVLDVGLGPATPEKAPPASTLGEFGRSFSFLLKDSNGKTLGKDPTLEGAVAALAELLKKGSDPYLSVRFDGALKLSDVRKACVILGMIEAGTGIKIEPPPQGHLYYKAFLPDERWRDRESRIAQPWELHLVRNKGGVSGTLILNEEVWADRSPEPKMKVTSFDLSTPKALRTQLDADAERRKLADKRPGLAVLLVFAEPDLPYGELIRFVGPALTTHNTVHVFLPLGN